MSTFDTHGGHFSPVGYLKVTTGGSHEENPNGGVQIGVDQNGIPNMLEEGEPVYKDFVYSDNINAESSMLEKYHIPVKYAGKLYSEIADIFVDEASERTNDGVTNNGLNAMLLRLANAQEEQKQIAEQKALEEELSQMSPEELAQLEEVLKAQIAQEEQLAEQQPIDESMQGVTEGVTPGVTTMAAGGPIRKFVSGGDVPPVGVINASGEVEYPAIEIDPETGEGYYTGYGRNDRIPMAYDENLGLVDKLPASGVVAYPGKTQAWVDAQTSPFRRGVTQAISDFPGKAYDVYRNNLGAQLATGIPGIVADAAGDIVDGNTLSGVGKLALAGASKVVLLPDAVSKVIGKINGTKLTRLAGKINELGSTLKYETAGTENAVKLQKELSKLSNEYREIVGKLNNMAAKEEGLRFLDKLVSGAGEVETVTPEVVETIADVAEPAVETAVKTGNGFGKKALKVIGAGAGVAGIGKLGQLGFRAVQTAKSNNRELVYAEPIEIDWANGGLMNRFDEAGKVTRMKTPILPWTDTAVKGWKAPGWDITMTGAPDSGWEGLYPKGTNIGLNRVPYIKQETIPEPLNEYSPLPTLSRYAGAFNNAAMAAYNLAQEPDRYTLPEYNVALPYGRMSLQRMSYNPMDIGLVANGIQSQGAGTVRELRNAGLGPSTGAAILAADYNNTRNLGTGFLQAWNANNERRNAVTGANNSAAAQEAQFNFNVDAARADAINRNNMLRQRYNLMLQQLNNEAEQAKFNAVGHETDALANALSGMGRENFIMNQINTNKALNYTVMPDGTGGYKFVPVRTNSACGGFIKRYKK